MMLAKIGARRAVTPVLASIGTEITRLERVQGRRPLTLAELKDIRFLSRMMLAIVATCAEVGE